MRREVPDLITTDDLFSLRLDVHLRRIMGAGMVLTLVLVFVHVVADGRFGVFAFHLATLVMAAFVFLRSRDAIETIIFTHTFWMFTAMTYFNATLNMQVATTGLVNPERAALIATVSQLALLIAHHFSPRRPIFAGGPGPFRLIRGHETASSSSVLALIGVAGLVLQWTGLLPTAYSESMILFLYVAIAVRIVSAGSVRLSDPVVLVAVALILMTVGESNSRTDLISFVIAMLFVWFMIARRPLNKWALMAGYLGYRLLSAFSSVIISVRPFRDEPQLMRQLFIERFFSVDTWRMIYRPWSDHPADQLFAGTKTTQSGFFSPFFNGAEASMLDRLTLLPRMDIVTGRLAPQSEVRWSDLFDQLFWTVLPNFGQSKNLIYSDQVVWELGLRARDNVGRPMITAEAELYVMGGLAAVAIVIGVCFWVMNLIYRWIARLTGLRSVAILVMSQFFINSILSTTALSTVLSTVRFPLQVALLIALVFWIRKTRLLPRGAQARRNA